MWQAPAEFILDMDADDLVEILFGTETELKRAPGLEAGRPASDDLVFTHASPRSAVGFLLHAAGLDRETLGPRINLTMPGVFCSVGEQIAALRRVAGEKAVNLIRRAPDKAVTEIVAGWPTGFEARRALGLGFRAEKDFDEIIRVHIEDELGGRLPH